MRLALCLIHMAWLVLLGKTEPWVINDAQEEADDLKTLKKQVKTLTNTLGALSRQVMLQQLFAEEKLRSDSDSGIKQVRHALTGTRNYHTPSHTNTRRILSIHDHSNNIRTVGMGEFVGVLNGVEFRTRHNDYRLYMSHKTSSKYHATDYIPFPDVPPEVLSKVNSSEQVVEMRKWFKAWKDQDHSTRDYRKYFKPVLCYLEGAWTTATKGEIDEPFESDRHFIDASSWFDLQDKIRFTSYTGRKDNLENFSFLPTTIMNIINNTYPQFAQWNYRILCHPISRDIPLNRFRVVDELAPRMTAERTYEEHSLTRAARFQLNPLDTNTWREGINGKKWGLLDELMSEIPGKDNHQGNLTDDAFDLPAYSLAPGKKKNDKLNVAFYHRWFKVGQTGAMGTSTRHRGYSDENLFMAMTTQPKIAGMNLRTCKGKGKNKVCKEVTQRWTYAIPLEIIYLTPLAKWNPYNLHYKGDTKSKLGQTVLAGGRNGGHSPAKAYNGTNSKLHYQTPAALFTGTEVGTDAADTTQGSVGVLDRNKVVRSCKASGTRVFFPNIPGVGILRQRYPILPVHGEGSPVWKELEATKDLILKSKTYGYVFREPLQSGPKPTEPPRKPIILQIPDATRTPPGRHRHDITLQPSDVDFLESGGRRNFTSTTASAHEHIVTVLWNKRRKKYEISNCDSGKFKGFRCWDRHTRWLIVKPNE